MVFRKTLKNFDLENFRSDSFSICTSCIESSRFRARVAKGGGGGGGGVKIAKILIT